MATPTTDLMARVLDAHGDARGAELIFATLCIHRLRVKAVARAQRKAAAQAVGEAAS